MAKKVVSKPSPGDPRYEAWFLKNCVGKGKVLPLPKTKPGIDPRKGNN